MTDTTAPVAALATREEYLEAISQVRAAADAFFNTDQMVMDDATYDTLTRGIAAAESAHPEWAGQDSPTATVGAGVSGSSTVAHRIPMLSLDNLFTETEVEDWVAARTRLLGRPVTTFVVEPKYDGNACSALYEDGKLVRIATRGDGTTGEDRTYAIDRITNLPRTLTQPFTGEVRGEVEFTTADYEAASAARVASGKAPYANARNGAAGAFGAETLTHDVTLTFFPYSIDGAEGVGTHLASLELMTELGFTSPASNLVRQATTAAEVNAVVDELSAMRATLGFAIDGAVIKVNDLGEQQTLGLASRAPRWGIAFKYPPDTAISTLEEVIWQVGRTGVITPRARIAPVEVGGTTITYATLHNPEDLARKGFQLADKVTVLRAGEVIPRLEAPLVNLRDGSQSPIEVPGVCPRCGAGIDRSQVRWRCTRGRYCGLGEAVRYAAARDCWDIEGMGDKIVEQLVSRQLVGDVADLFTLTREDLLSLERMGETSADKLLEQIASAKTQPLARTVTALGIRGTGRTMSRRLAKHFTTMEALVAATAEELETVDGVGGEKAPLIVAELAEVAPVIAKLVDAGVTMTEPSPAAAAGATGASAAETTDLPLAGKTVVVTGSMTGPLAALTRNEVNELVERAGGKSSGSVSAKTHVLVAGEKAGSKLAKAQTLIDGGADLVVLSPEEFADKVAAFLP